MTASPAAPLPAQFEFDSLRHARRYRELLVGEFGASLRGRVLEVGAGVGQMSAIIRSRPGVRSLLALEPEGHFCQRFRKTLPGQPLVQGTIDAVPPRAEWDAIVNINVLEHIRDDEAELRRYCARLVPEAGRLCLFVPARPEIYAPIDRDFGHFRRYTRPGLRARLEGAGFEVLRADYFGFVGYLGWWFNFCLLRRRRFGVGMVKIFDRAVLPVAHWLESRVMRPPVGQSLLAIARPR